MSYLLFGTVTPIPADFAEKGDDFGFSVRMQSEEIPKIVDEMLDLKTETAAAEKIARFFVAASASDDTSDALISPFEQTTETIFRNLAALQLWLQEILATSDGAIRLYLAEGFDDKFEHHAVKAKDFRATLCKIIRNDGDWPSLAVEVRR